jgi:hypothetical protein
MCRLLWAVAVALGAAVCGSCATERPASITVALSSEAPIPTGIDRIRITVTDRGTPKLDRDYDVGPGETRLPGTLVLHREDDEDTFASVTVLIRAYSLGELRSSRRATLGFVSGKQKLLRMPIQFACFDTGCKEGETCKAGACVPDAVSADALPDFEEKLVFPAAGSCFDRDRCIEENEHEMTLEEFRAREAADPSFFDRDRCTIPSDDPGTPDQNVNMGFVWTLNPEGEWTSVDFDSVEGWQFDDASRTRIRLSPGLCAELKKDAPRIAEIVTSKGCPPKPPTQPECPSSGEHAD